MSEQLFSPKTLAISIVSHGQGQLIQHLLEDLKPLMSVGAELLLTLNIPEDESFIKGYENYITVIRNSTPKGFGANHNSASAMTGAKWLAVLNPDIRCESNVFAAMMTSHHESKAGVSAPRVVGSDGHNEDSVRRYPSLMRILRRTCSRLLGHRLFPDYPLSDEKIKVVDWVAGMFLLFKSEDYRRIGGFDTRYFMYLEDADICRRLTLQGLPVIVVPAVQVVHNARRATSHNFQHFRWHIFSMLRFLFVAPWSRPQSSLHKFSENSF